MNVALVELLVADPPDAWRDAGFAVDPDGSCRVGSARMRLLGPDAGRGVIGWTLRAGHEGVRPDDIDGIATTWIDGAPAAPAEAPVEPPVHPNGVTGIDHVVVLTPALARTVAALEAIGLDVRRERDGSFGGRPMRQVFFRAGEVVIEVVGDPDAAGPGPATLWGITHTVVDIDHTAALLADRVGRVKDAVQPGRRITTLRHRDAGLSVATAFISPYLPRS
ncbi:VOC family protein [Nocardioides caeni]|uniref:Glyoxalase n=1 Tax=Nocardioides caeni TaxID=574700 RepID=A0A4S8N5F5_9ACTN|nr:VOC family protein [Nocardioides caeni]THV10821.1 glyoxalase [Nocardioides caeni]